MIPVDLCQLAQEEPEATKELLEKVLTKMTKEELIAYAEKLKQAYLSADKRAEVQEQRVQQLTREARMAEARNADKIKGLIARLDYLVKGIEQLNRSTQLIKGEL